MKVPTHGSPRGSWTAAALIVLLLAVLAPGAAAQVTGGVNGTIRGRVVDELTGRGVAHVTVEILDHVERIRRRAVTDQDGSFVIGQVWPGPFWLRATHTAYQRVKTPQWRIEAGEVLTVTVRIHPQVVILTPLEVNARARTVSPVLAGFYSRLESRVGGTLLTRAQIEERNPSRVSDLFRDLPGFRLQADPAAMGQAFITSARALPGAGDGGCPVQIYVDGVWATRGRRQVSPDEILSPGNLEGVEVYSGLSTIPPEFLSPEARCGVIAFWTRRGS